MKYIIATIKPGRLDAMREVVSEIGGTGMTGMTVSAVKGFGRRKGHKEP